MGRAKQFLIEQQERGYLYIGDECVCARCISEPALALFIRDNAVSRKCDYCGRRGKYPIAAPIDEVLGQIVEGLESEWGDPINEGVAYETREGGWQGPVVDTYDLIFDKGLLPVENELLRKAILESIGHRQWCQSNFYGLQVYSGIIHGGYLL